MDISKMISEGVKKYAGDEGLKILNDVSANSKKIEGLSKISMIIDEIQKKIKQVKLWITVAFFLSVLSICLSSVAIFLVLSKR